MAHPEKPRLMALDASDFKYIPIIRQAADVADWAVLPYDNEAYALDDIESEAPAALAVIVHDSSFAYQSYVGKHLLEVAATQTPYAVIARQGVLPALEAVTSPNLFIPRDEPAVVDSLATWLVSLTAKNA